MCYDDSLAIILDFEPYFWVYAAPPLLFTNEKGLFFIH